MQFVLYFTSLNLIPTCRSEVLYSNKKLSSSTFQRFHCLTLDLSNNISSSSSSSAGGSTNSSINTLSNNDLNFPQLKSTENKPTLRVYSENYSSAGSSEGKIKMTLDLALQKYFQLEVCVCVYVRVCVCVYVCM